MIDEPIEIKITNAHLWSEEMSLYVTSPILFAMIAILISLSLKNSHPIPLRDLVHSVFRIWIHNL